MINKSGKKLYESFSTKEHFHANNLLIIRDLLEDLKLEVTDFSQLTKINRRLKCINRVFMTESFTMDLDVSTIMISRQRSYGYIEPNKIGRIYSSDSSIALFPKDLRYFLFRESYKNFDLKNCHPTILYEFAKKHTSLSIPYLEELVMDRSAFYDKVSSQLINNRDPKRSVIISMYAEESVFNTKSDFLMSFHRELGKLRAELRDYLSTQSSAMFYQGKKPSTLQSYFCMTRESEMLLSVKTFLEKKIPNNHDLHFIPFYGGAYIKHDDYMITNQLDDYIKEYNSGQEFLMFVNKPMELPENSLINASLFETYKVLKETLHDLKVVDFNKLIKKLSLDPFSIPDALLEEIESEMKERKQKIVNLKQQLKMDKINKDLEAELHEIIPLGFLQKKHLAQIQKITRVYKKNIRKALLEANKGTERELKECICEILLKLNTNTPF